MAGDILDSKGHSTNMVGIPTGLLASAAFNDYPLSLRLSGVRQMNPSLFTMLDQAETIAEAGIAFTEYMAAVFGLDPEMLDKHQVKGQARRFRSSYLRLLKGWGYDSNAREGAVMKGWTESRFGLYPTFHKEPITRFSSDAYMHYLEEKMCSRFHNNAIYMQLDLMYEFCQWALPRFFTGSARHITLYRGVNDYAEHPVVETIDKRNRIVRLNNLMSFTDAREVADTFGDYILEARVPVSKILFFKKLLPNAPLKGEEEYVVVGGDYRVTACTL